jgi:tetratricopeptide (TPR) repeat protein
VTQGPQTARLAALARTLSGEGRHDDALAVLEHLLTLTPGDADLVLDAVRALAGKGETLAALRRLIALKALSRDPGALLGEIQAQSLPAVERFNAHLAAGEIVEAEAYAAALAELAPRSPAMLGAALACNQALGRAAEVERFAKALLAAEPDNAEARAALADQAEGDPEAAAIVGEMARALSAENPDHPLLRLRDIHDVSSRILCRPLTDASQAQLETLLAAGRALAVVTEPGSDWEGWEKHYRVLLQGVDLDAVRGATPPAAPEPEAAFATASGAPLDLAGVRATAERLGAEVVFFAAADETYVDLYARWYALSVLKYCDVPCLIVVHVIGGLGRLAQIAAGVGIDDERLIFAADGFDAAGVSTRCYDAPPKGLSPRPIAHFQSVRFLRLGALLENLARPVFVSDIDLLLQRGVQDLLASHAGADVVFNENALSLNAGSRLTANLVLVYPTTNAQVLLRFLRSYLERALAGEEVTRWVDQLALVLARHHLVLRGADPRIGYFDTASDINNVMYTTYQAHPFRFLSLFHGFDTSSLEGDPRIAG